MDEAEDIKVRANQILDHKSLCFLRAHAQTVLQSCSVAPGSVCGGYVNRLGFKVITPGGYPAVWVQDFTMNFSSGLVDRDVGLEHLRLILSCQNGDDARDLGAGVKVPAYSIADHILLDGAEVFFPGTYDPNAHQGGAWGFRPPTNNHYDVVWLAYMLAHGGDATVLLQESIRGFSIFDRMELAFAVPEVDPVTELVHTTAEHRAVGFIFCDSIHMTGYLLMASLLRHRAAEQLAWMARGLGNTDKATKYTAIAARIAATILPIFGPSNAHAGWLQASTGLSGQADVWGTIYAIYRGIVTGIARQAILETIVAALTNDGEIEFEGALRHVPLSGDASAETAWERTDTPKNRYQNGAYWHTPVGWLLAILWQDYPEMAAAVRDRWLGHLRSNEGKIWECIGWNSAGNQNPGFAPSITLPLGVLMPE